jgi:hypothetical protein
VSRADRAHQFEPPVGLPVGPPGREERLVAPADLARTRRLPVLPALAPLLPGGGLQRGTTVAVGTRDGLPGATSLALALAAGASQAGSWVAAVGLGALGLVAAAELGVALDRLVLVADPGRQREGWASVVAALVDGFDVVLVAGQPEGRDRGQGEGRGQGRGQGQGRGPGLGRGTGLRPADARRLVARARERGAVLMTVGGDLPGERSPVRLTVVAAAWTGLGEGWGHLAGRRVTVEAGGRGEAARPRRAELWLPDAGGAVGAVEPVTDPIPLHPRPPGAVGAVEPVTDPIPLHPRPPGAGRGRRRRSRGAGVAAGDGARGPTGPTGSPTGPGGPTGRPTGSPTGPGGPTGPGVVGLPGAPVAGG